MELIKDSEVGTVEVVNDRTGTFSSLLEDSDFRVISSKGDLEEVANEIESTLPDLVVICVGVTGKYGILLCRELKKRRSTRMIPVVFLAKDSRLVEDKSAFIYGCIDYVKDDETDLVGKVSSYIKLGKVEKSLKRLRDRYDTCQNI